MNSNIALPVDGLPTGGIQAAQGGSPFAMPQAAPTKGPGYAALLQQALASIDDKNQAATESMASVARRESDNLIGAVLQIQDARLTFEFALQVRNRLVEGYHELFNQNT